MIRAFLILFSCVSLFAQRTSLKVNGTVINNPNLTNSASVTYTVNGANVSASAIGGTAGTAGTLVNPAPTASVDGQIPQFDGTTGTNVIPSVDNLVAWDGSQATRTLTFNLSGTDPVITAGSAVLNLSTGSLGVGQQAPLAPLHVGSGNTNNSSDAMVLVSRTMSGTGSGHAFSDSSFFNRGNNDAFNSFDARAVTGGSATYDHYAGFQAAPTFGGTSTMNFVYGLISAPTINSGSTVGISYGVYVADPVGAGTMSGFNYGLYVPQLSKGAQNYAVFTAGTTPSSFGGAVTVGGQMNTATIISSGDIRAGRKWLFLLERTQ